MQTRIDVRPIGKNHTIVGALRALAGRAGLAALVAAVMALQALVVPEAMAAPRPEPVPPRARSVDPGPAQNPDAVSVYGPESFTRQSPPAAVTRTFALPTGVVPPYSVHVVNGDADGTDRVTSATIRLNGADLFTPSDFNHNVPSLDRSCALKGNNTLDVRINGPDGGRLTVEFIATQARLDLVVPSTAVQGQTVTVSLTGRNTHWTPGETQARFGGEVSVGGGAPGEFGAVTVTSPTTATAEVTVWATAALAPRAVTVTTPASGDLPDEVVTLANGFTVRAATAPAPAANRVSTIAGEAVSPGLADGPGTTARFMELAGLAVGPDDTIYVADAGNHTVRAVRAVEENGATVWQVTTLAGDGIAGSTDGVGAGARFRTPKGVAVDAAGTVYVADTGNHRIRRVAPNGAVTTLAGDGTPGYRNGAGAEARFSAPQGVAVDVAGTVYVADSGNSSVRAISPSGEVSTVAGDGTAGSNDSPNARLSGVVGVAVDGTTVYVYLADTDNHRIRSLSPAGTVLTIAGAGRGFADGTGAEARFADPSGIAIDELGRVVVADSTNSLVRTVDPSRATANLPAAVWTVAGTGDRGAADGTGDAAMLRTPRGVAVTASSALVVADTGNHTLRRIVLAPVVTGLAPGRARVGETIRIGGEHFDGRSPSRNQVRFARAGGGEVAAEVVAATRTELTVEVPGEAATGPVAVETEGGVATSPGPFEVVPPEPVIASFSPSRGQIGATVTILGSNLMTNNQTPAVTFAGSFATRIDAAVTFAAAGEVRVLVPNGAITGRIQLVNAGGMAVSPTDFTVEAERGFELVAAPSSTRAVQGGTGLYVVSVTSGQPGFSNLVRLSTEGLPADVVATFDPPQIAAGATSTLSLTVAGNVAAGSYPFTVRGVSEVDGSEMAKTVSMTLEVLGAGQTTLAGRVLSIDNEPIPGATVSLDGQTATTDAAGAFLLSGIAAGPERPLMVDGRTASVANRSYPIILEPATVVAGQANQVPYIFYLPPIDTQYEVDLVPGQTTTVTSPRMPGVRLTIPSDANLRNRDGSPVTRVSITPVPIDRTPAPLPSSVATGLVVTAQPGGALSDVALPISFPNTLGLNPGERADLYTFDHDNVRWYVYGYGRVSSDGRTVEPEIDPATGRPYGLPNFSWHFASFSRSNVGNGQCEKCVPTRTNKPVDLVTGAKIEMEADVAFGGALGAVAWTRNYSSLRASSVAAGPLGAGWSHSYEVRLEGDFAEDGAGRVVMPSEVFGRLFSYVRTEGTTLVFATTAATAQLGDELRKYSDGRFEYRTKTGGVLAFDSTRRLVSIANRNGNAVTLAYTGGRLTRITDPVNRSLVIAYDGAGRIASVTDPIERTWSFDYDASGRLATVTDPMLQVRRYGSNAAGLLETVTDRRQIVTKRVTYNAQGQVTRQEFADTGVITYDYAFAGQLTATTVVTDQVGRRESMRISPGGYALETVDGLGQKGTIERDPATNLATSKTGPCGCAEATYEHDAAGNVRAMTDRLGHRQETDYESAFNNVTRVEDERHNETFFRYDARGNLIEFDPPGPERMVIGVNALGLPETMTDALDHTWRVVYDAMGNVEQAVDPLEHATRFEYDPLGRVTAAVDALERRTEFTYDLLGRVRTVRDSAGAVTTYGYDPNDNTTSVENANHKIWEVEYDAKDRPEFFKDPLGRRGQRIYNRADELIETISPAGRHMVFSYDPRGRSATVTDPMSGVVRFTYDAYGLARTLEDQRGNVTTWDYDERHQVVATRDPLGRVSTASYDEAGNLQETIDRLGRRVTLHYDALNRTDEVRYADATVAITRDGAGRTTRVDDTQSGSVGWTYDNANRLLTETTPAGSVEYSYNDADQVATMTARPVDSPSRLPVAYGYDAAARLETITQGTEVFAYSYDSLSRLASLARPNGVVTDYTFDDVDRLARMRHRDVAGTAIEDYRYAYTLDDEIESIESLASASLLPTAAGANTADAANRVGQFGSASSTFDDEGQTRSRTDGATSATYTWDARGRLTGAALGDGRQVSYGYDAAGRRLSRTAGAQSMIFLYDGADVVVDRAIDGAIVEYINGPGIDNKLRQEGPSGSSLYFLQDHLGSTTALANAGGAVVERQAYEPFGATSGGSLSRYGYAGREREELTGFIYNRARWLDPQQGRFLTEDPIGVMGGLNLYNYVGNDPVSLTDPLGLNPDGAYARWRDKVDREPWKYPKQTPEEGRMALDVAGEIPGPIGVGADVVSGIWSFCEGDYLGAGISGAAIIIPGLSAFKLTRRARRATFFHGTDVGSAGEFLGGAGLDFATASSRKVDGPPGFFLATHAEDAEFFAARRSPGTILEFQLSKKAVNDLSRAGVFAQPIPPGKFATFKGGEMVVTPSAFDTFNRLLESGDIRVCASKFRF